METSNGFDLKAEGYAYYVMYRGEVHRGPWTEAEVEEWIAELATRKLIIRYEVGSQKYIAITNFKKHQTINRPQASKLPAPVLDESQPIHGTFSDQSMNDHAQGKGKEGKGREKEWRGLSPLPLWKKLNLLSCRIATQYQLKTL